MYSALRHTEFISSSSYCGPVTSTRMETEHSFVPVLDVVTDQLTSSWADGGRAHLYLHFSLFYGS